MAASLISFRSVLIYFRSHAYEPVLILITAFTLPSSDRQTDGPRLPTGHKLQLTSCPKEQPRLLQAPVHSLQELTQQLSPSGPSYVQRKNSNAVWQSPVYILWCSFYVNGTDRYLRSVKTGREAEQLGRISFFSCITSKWAPCHALIQAPKGGFSPPCP